jgi:hypothetical protein
MDEPTDLYENENPDGFCPYCGYLLDDSGRCPADADPGEEWCSS